jgi:hypothetical protein
MGRIAWGAAVAGAAYAILVGTASATDQLVEPRVYAATPDGRTALIGSYERLSTEDADDGWDIFLWKDGESRVVSVGMSDTASYSSAGGNFLSDDGKRVVFTSFYALAPNDTDQAFDVYERAGGRTTLLSTGPTDPGTGFYPNDSSFKAASADGAVVFFTTSVRMVAADDDDAQDVYRRENGVTTLVTTDSLGRNTAGALTFKAASPDGSRVLVTTTDSLLPEDQDGGKVDAYAVVNGAPQLVTKGNSAQTTDDADVRSITPDAASVVFSTADRLVPGDLDRRPDFYQRRNGQTLLVSANANGRSLPCTKVDPNLSPYDCVPFAVSQSPTGAHVLFTTDESLASDDRNDAYDLYDRHDGTTDWLTRGGDGDGAGLSPGPVLDDGSRMLFETAEALDPRDTDNYSDVYERVDGTPRLLSTGPAAPGHEDVWRAGQSTDLRHVFFNSREPMVSADRDAVLDVYEAFDGNTTLVSTGPTDASGPNNAMPWDGVITPSGSHVFFVTSEPLTAGDTDDDPDAYVRSGGQTTLLTPG